MLMSAFVVLSLAITALFCLHHRKIVADNSAAALAAPQRDTIPARKHSFISVLGFSTLVICSSALLYSQLGRYADHQLQRPDNQLDYVLREQLQQLEQHATTTQELEQLAQGYAQLGQYEQAASTMMSLSDRPQANSRQLALQAKFNYYRDGRLLTTESHLLVSRSLALDPAEPEALLLLANDAYLNQNYAKALDYWQILIDAAPLGVDLEPIHRAMTKAQSKLAALD